MKDFMIKNWFLFVSISIGVFLRLIFVDRIPTSVTGDELVYIFNAKLFLLGSNILHGWNPLLAFLFQYPPHIFPQAELPYVIAVVSGFSSSLLLLRLPYVMMSVGIIVVLYLIGRELLNEKAGRFIALVAALNPWCIVMGRTMYEVTPAMLFYLLGIYCLIKAKKLSMFTWSFIFFLLGFYSYIATKLIFLPVIILTCLFAYVTNTNKDQKKYYGGISVAGVVVVCCTFLFLHAQPGSRLGEIFLPTNPIIAQQVISIRQGSIPFPLDNLVINKMTVYVSDILTKTIAAISLDDLFSYGDMFYGLGTFGLFYLIDFIFLLSGVVWVYRKQHQVGLFLSALFFIGLIPQVFYKGTDLFTPHITFVFPVMIIFIGAGIAAFLESPSVKKYLLPIIGIGYLYCVSQFAANYFFRYPLSPQSDFPVRIVSSYINRVNTPVIVYANHAEDIYKKYLLYENRLNPKNLSEIDSSINKKIYSLKNVRFVSCDTTLLTEGVKGVVITQSECGKIASAEGFHKVSLLIDGGEVYRIYHDTLCPEDILPTYPAKSSLRQFAVEKLTDAAYCQTFISK